MAFLNSELIQTSFVVVPCHRLTVHILIYSKNMGFTVYMYTITFIFEGPYIGEKHTVMHCLFSVQNVYYTFKAWTENWVFS